MPDHGVDRLDKLQARLREFRNRREWEQFHTLKDLAAAIAIEASELQEILLWRPSSEEQELLETKLDRLEDELADVLIHCLNFADVAGIDVLDAIEMKISKNEVNYPVDKARGSPEKYTDL
jgi:NTP pyrophosphatase (non-canonical NTP hydrolase)